MCLRDCSQHAKTREVLQQAVLVKRCLSKVPAIHYCCFVVFNEALVLWYWRRAFFSHQVVKLHWPFSLKLLSEVPESKLTAICMWQQRMLCVYSENMQTLFPYSFNESNYRVIAATACLHLLFHYDHAIIGFWSHLILNRAKFRFCFTFGDSEEVFGGGGKKLQSSDHMNLSQKAWCGLW